MRSLPVLGLVTIALVSAACARADSRPTIVVYVVDDLDVPTFAELDPLGAIAARGMRFGTALSPTPVCAAARASILTGLYAHNHGIFTNSTDNEERWERIRGSAFPSWLRVAGYRTILAGKYINGVTVSGGDSWDVTLAVRGRYRPDGLSRHGEYWLDDLTRRAVQAIHATPEGLPLLLYFAPPSPHGPFVPNPKYRGALDGVPIQWPPNFNEEDLSDKPPSSAVHDRRSHSLSAKDIEKIAARHRTRREMLLSVADSIESLLAALGDTGRAANTYFIFVSDHGFLDLGQHRRMGGKKSPYEEAIRVPLFALGPEITPGMESHSLVSVHDIAPTIADLAQVPPPTPVDGRSLVSLWRKSKPWRRRIVLDQRDDAAFTGIRTTTKKLVQYPNGDRELYQLTTDPFEMESTCRPNVRERCGDNLAKFLPRLLDCKGQDCWDVETTPARRE